MAPLGKKKSAFGRGVGVGVCGVPVSVGGTDRVGEGVGAVGLGVAEGLAVGVPVVVGDGVGVAVGVGGAVGVGVHVPVAVGVGVKVAHNPAPGVPEAWQTALNTGAQESPH